MPITAYATIVPADRVATLHAAVMPKRYNPREPYVDFDDVLKREGRARHDFTQSNAALIAVLSYFDDNNLPLMRADHSETARAIALAQAATCFILSQPAADVAAEIQKVLDNQPAIERFYEEQYEESVDVHTRKALAQAIAFVRTALGAASDTTVAVVMIG